MVNQTSRSYFPSKNVSVRKGTPDMGIHQKHILIVDDFKDDRDMYGHYLVQKGFRVSFAVDGQEAIDKAFQLQPDLILMDLWLPIIGGWEATRRLKSDEKTKHIPIVVLTARAFVVAASLGCDGCLIKPCLPEDMTAEINRIFTKSAQATAIPAQAGVQSPTAT